MRDDGLATYEKWDMTAPVVPPRTRFFNLSPAGFGTSMVECLTSYISRLAQAHSVTPGVLHHREVMKHGPTHRNMFAKIAHQLHEQGIELFVNRVLTRMSVPKSLHYRIACELLAEIKREISANPKPPNKPRGTMAKQRPSPDALRA